MADEGDGGRSDAKGEHSPALPRLTSSAPEIPDTIWS
jgi:hypothetical protein